MIECYDEKIYSYWSMIFGMICFMPIFIICIGGGIASAVIWIIKKIRGKR